jgi:DNA-3-methyladenine glycosylase II
MARLIKAHPGSVLRSRGNAFETLLRAIVGQQISVRAADAVWARLATATPIRPADLADLTVDRLRACGLSRMKAEYTIDLAGHFVEGRIRPQRWARMQDDAIVRELTDVRGIGRWTAEMFLIFHLLRPNVWPVDDLGLLKALRLHYGAAENLTARAASAWGEQWQPWRTVATWYLWRSLDPYPVEY